MVALEAFAPARGCALHLLTSLLSLSSPVKRPADQGVHPPHQGGTPRRGGEALTPPELPTSHLTATGFVPAQLRCSPRACPHAALPHAVPSPPYAASPSPWGLSAAGGASLGPLSTRVLPEGLQCHPDICPGSPHRDSQVSPNSLGETGRPQRSGPGHGPGSSQQINTLKQATQR